MVKGLGGASLPPRPGPRRPGAAGCQLMRVQSTSLSAIVPQQAESEPAVQSLAAHVGEANEPALPDKDGARSAAADGVGTPTGDPPQPQPARSDQSNVKGAAHVQEQARVQQQPEQRLQQPGEGAMPAAHEAQSAPLPAHSQEADQPARQQQQPQQRQIKQQHQEQITANQPAAEQPAARGRKRKQTVAPHAEDGRQQDGGMQRRVSRHRSGSEPKPAAAPRRGRHASAPGDSAATVSLDAAATGAAKRRRSGAAGGRGAKAPRHGPSQCADLLHRTVEVPGAVFFVDEPGAVYVGRVNKLEKHRQVPAVEVQFRDDNSKYWFPVEDVRGWMADMVRAGKWEQYNPEVPPPLPPAPAGAPGEEEKTAAQALQSLSASLCSTSMHSKEGGAQPALSSGRCGGSAAATAAAPPDGAAQGAKQLQRVGSELKRAGALDIMVAAADMGPVDSSPH